MCAGPGEVKIEEAMLALEVGTEGKQLKLPEVEVEKRSHLDVKSINSTHALTLCMGTRVKGQEHWETL